MTYKMLSLVCAHGECLVSDMLCSAVYCLSACTCLCTHIMWTLPQVFRLELMTTLGPRHTSIVCLSSTLLFYALVWNVANVSNPSTSKAFPTQLPPSLREMATILMMCEALLSFFLYSYKIYMSTMSSFSCF